MTDLLKLSLGVLASLFRSRAKLEAKNLVLETPRTLFVTQEVWDAVHEPFPAGYETLHSEFRQTLDGWHCHVEE